MGLMDRTFLEGRDLACLPYSGFAIPTNIRSQGECHRATVHNHMWTLQM
jgi:hypothetical protein